MVTNVPGNQPSGRSGVTDKLAVAFYDCAARTALLHILEEPAHLKPAANK